jgi:hypothetical protein
MKKKEEKYPALKEYTDNTSSFLQHGLSQIDEDRAVQVAKLYWDSAPKGIKEILKKYIKSQFELWKVEHGSPPLSLGGFLLNRIDTTGDSEADRFLRIEKLMPWECTPPWVGNNPLDLLYHIWVNGYWTIGYHEMLCGLAWLIIESSNKKNTSYRPAMVKYALLLSEIRREIMEDVGNDIFLKYKKLIKGRKNLFEYNDSESKRVSQQEQDILDHASRLLKSGKTKDKIIGIITESKLHTNQRKNASKDLSADSLPVPLSERHIRRVLKSHPSGLWVPKKKK